MHKKQQLWNQHVRFHLSDHSHVKCSKQQKITTTGNTFIIKIKALCGASSFIFILITFDTFLCNRRAVKLISNWIFTLRVLVKYIVIRLSNKKLNIIICYYRQVVIIIIIIIMEFCKDEACSESYVRWHLLFQDVFFFYQAHPFSQESERRCSGFDWHRRTLCSAKRAVHWPTLRMCCTASSMVAPPNNQWTIVGFPLIFLNRCRSKWWFPIRTRPV